MPTYLRYRVTYKGHYLFHCIGTDADDAIREARTLGARQGMRGAVLQALSVARD